MQRRQGVVHTGALGQQALAAADDLGVGALRQIDLILDEQHHGAARGQKVDGVQPVAAEHVGDLCRSAQQRLVVGADAVQQGQPLRAVLPQQRLPPPVKGAAHRRVYAQRQPPCQKVAAQSHIPLAVALDAGVGALQRDVGVGEPALQKGGLGVHELFRSLPVAVCDLVVVGHTLVHVRQLAVQRPGLPVEHHQHRRRAEAPAALAADGDGRTGHPRAGAAVQAAHLRDIVVHQEAHDEIALAQQIAPLLRRHGGVLINGRQQQRLQLQHFGDLPPGEHPAHQHQQGQRVLLQHVRRAVIQKCQHVRGLQGRQQDAGVEDDHPQQRVIAAASAIGGHGVKILAVRLVPDAAAIQIALLRLRRQGGKRPLGAVLHHVVEAVGHAVRQPPDKGVLLRQRRQQLGGFVIFRDEAGHLGGEFVGKAHYRQKLLLLRGQRVDHGGREHGIDVRGVIRQRTVLRQCPQIQIDCGEPALAGAEQRLYLRIGQDCAAAAGVNGQLRVVQPQLLRADLAEPPSQPQRLLTGEEPVAAGHDQVYVVRQAVGQCAEKAGDAAIRQQVKIVDKQIAAHRPCQRMAQIIGQQTGAGVVGGAGIALQQGQTRMGKGILHAFPEDGQIVGVNTDTDDAILRLLFPLGQIPADGGGLAVAHGSHHRGQGAEGQRAKVFLQPLRYVNGIQRRFLLRHR